MKDATAHKLITCVLPKGAAMPVMEVLTRELGVTGVDIHHARGLGRITPLRHRGVGETSEKEILTVVVPQSEADELFEYIYEIADINRPHGGLMYMQAYIQATRYRLPDIAEES